MFEVDRHEAITCSRELEHSESVAEHFSNFWSTVDFESFFEIEDLAEATTDESRLALGKKLAELYQIDREERGL